MNFNYSDWINRFDLKNNTLSMLISEVAIDISRSIYGIYEKPTGDEPAKYLSKLLEKITWGENL